MGGHKRDSGRMPLVILRVKDGFNLNNHLYLTKKAGIGNYLLICHIPQLQIQGLKLDPCVESLRVEKWLKTYFKD